DDSRRVVGRHHVAVPLADLEERVVEAGHGRLAGELERAAGKIAALDAIADRGRRSLRDLVWKWRLGPDPRHVQCARDAGGIYLHVQWRRQGARALGEGVVRRIGVAARRANAR